jgi:hypothetical protein
VAALLPALNNDPLDDALRNGFPENRVGKEHPHQRQIGMRLHTPPISASVTVRVAYQHGARLKDQAATVLLKRV